MAKFVLLCILSMLASIPAQRITTIQLDGVQYFISRMNPYSPELNYFLAYQYCRSLGLQLASFETKEKVESMSQYLQNAGYSKYDFWTSGNRLGTGMFLWMSTGLPFNATFDYFENSADAVQAGLLDPVDHNSNTSPQRTARDSSSGMGKGCVVMKAPKLKWMPEDCSIVKDFICEQTRCYYYNYGSIPVSSAQGRPIVSTTTTRGPAYFTSTTPFPPMMTSTYANMAKSQLKNQGPVLSMMSPSEDISEPSLASLKLDHEHDLDVDEEQNEHQETSQTRNIQHLDSDPALMMEEHVEDLVRNLASDDNEKDIAAEEEHITDEENNSSEASVENQSPSTLISGTASEMPSVEQRLKQISHEIEKLGSGENNNDSEIGRQSFLSLSDLIRTLRPNDKKIPQIDSDYSNTMRVLGETSSMVGAADEARKLKIMENSNTSN